MILRKLQIVLCLCRLIPGREAAVYPVGLLQRKPVLGRFCFTENRVNVEEHLRVA